MIDAAAFQRDQNIANVRSDLWPFRQSILRWVEIRHGMCAGNKFRDDIAAGDGRPCPVFQHGHWRRCIDAQKLQQVTIEPGFSCP